MIGLENYKDTGIIFFYRKKDCFHLIVSADKALLDCKTCGLCLILKKHEDFPDSCLTLVASQAI